MMTLLYTDELFLKHETGRHPEKAERLRRTMERLNEKGLSAKCRRGEFGPIGMDQLLRVHLPQYVQQVEQFCRQGGGLIEGDTVVSPQSYEVALEAAGAVAAAVDAVMTGPEKRALCLVRPPGHHALPAYAMGFCLFNNIAIGARHAEARHELQRIMIVDWDVHHGNGTQDIFYRDGRVLFYSIHRFPFYPGTGAADETGSGPGLGFTRNVPVRFGTPRKDFLARFRNALEESADKMKPELVFISAGFDAHREDPVGSLGLEAEDFATMSQWVVEVATTHAQGRLASVLEGGYNIERLAESVEAHLEVMLKS